MLNAIMTIAIWSGIALIGRITIVYTVPCIINATQIAIDAASAIIAICCTIATSTYAINISITIILYSVR